MVSNYPLMRLEWLSEIVQCIYDLISYVHSIISFGLLSLNIMHMKLCITRCAFVNTRHSTRFVYTYLCNIYTNSHHNPYQSMQIVNYRHIQDVILVCGPTYCYWWSVWEQRLTCVRYHNYKHPELFPSNLIAIVFSIIALFAAIIDKSNGDGFHVPGAGSWSHICHFISQFINNPVTMCGVFIERGFICVNMSPFTVFTVYIFTTHWSTLICYFINCVKICLTMLLAVLLCA